MTKAAQIVAHDSSDDALVIFTPSGKRGRFPLGTPVLTAALYERFRRRGSLGSIAIPSAAGAGFVQNARSRRAMASFPSMACMSMKMH